MFVLNTQTGAITMHAGDTGSIKVHATRQTGDDWTSADRMVYTIVNANGMVVLKRYYRLDTSLGNGRILVQFHNDDTDDLAPGNYSAERRYVVNPRWEGTVPTGDVTDALAEGIGQIVDGDVVRVPSNGQTALTIQRVYGEV